MSDHTTEAAHALLASAAPLAGARHVALSGLDETERHGERKTHKRFGEYIDTYKLMDAVKDGATLQILYEGRTAETAITDKPAPAADAHAHHGHAQPGWLRWHQRPSQLVRMASQSLRSGVSAVRCVSTRQPSRRISSSNVR